MYELFLKWLLRRVSILENKLWRKIYVDRAKRRGLLNK